MVKGTKEVTTGPRRQGRAGAILTSMALAIATTVIGAPAASAGEVAGTLSNPEHFGFGRDVAIASDTVVVGAPGRYGGNPIPGVAFLYVRQGGDFREARLLPSDSVPGDGFGQSVDVQGNTVVVVSGQPDGTPAAVYVFVMPPGGWQGTVEEVARLQPSDSENGRFPQGAQVAIGSLFGGVDLVFVSTPGRPYVHCDRSYVYREPHGGWADAESFAAPVWTHRLRRARWARSRREG